jgi:hypothetical protein
MRLVPFGHPNLPTSQEGGSESNNGGCQACDPPGVLPRREQPDDPEEQDGADRDEPTDYDGLTPKNRAFIRDSMHPEGILTPTDWLFQKIKEQLGIEENEEETEEDQVDAFEDDVEYEEES